MARLSAEQMTATVLSGIPETGSVPFDTFESTIPQEQRGEVLPFLKNLKMSGTIRTYFGTDPESGDRVHYITRDPAVVEAKRAEKLAARE